MPSGGPRARKSDRIYADIAADLVTGSLSQREIARYYGVSDTFVSAVSTNLATYGEARAPPSAVNGRPRKITYEIECGLHDFLDQRKHTIVQLNDVVDFVREKYNVEISKSTAHSTLKRLNRTRKPVTNMHLNQDTRQCLEEGAGV